MWPSPIKYLYITGVLVEVIAIEAMVNGLSEKFDIPLPIKMPVFNDKSKETNASFLFKLSFLVRNAKKNLKSLGYTKKLKSKLILHVNQSLFQVKRMIQFRNNLAHGKIFYLMNDKQTKLRPKLSYYLRNINGKEYRRLSHSCSVLKDFCEVLHDSDWLSLSQQAARVRLAMSTKDKMLIEAENLVVSASGGVAVHKTG